MINSFLILFITVKAKITMVLQCVDINTPSVIWKGIERKYSLYFSNSFPSPLPHTHLPPFYLSFVKKNKSKRVRPIRKKRNWRVWKVRHSYFFSFICEFLIFITFCFNIVRICFTHNFGLSLLKTLFSAIYKYFTLQNH